VIATWLQPDLGCDRFDGFVRKPIDLVALLALLRTR
jgi:hypothetical protein